MLVLFAAGPGGPGDPELLFIQRSKEYAYDRFYLYRLEAGRGTVYITRLLRTLKSLGITLSVTFDTGEPAAGDGPPDG